MSTIEAIGETHAHPRPLAQRGGGKQQIGVPAPYLARITDGITVAAYIPLGSEADPAALVAAALDGGCVLALPHVTIRDAPMRFLRWHPDDPLEFGPMRLRQPVADAPEIAPDIILVPLLAFDARMHRLGQGAGYYDRALALLPAAWRLGVAWSVQQVTQVPVDRWDVPLHGVVTERTLHLPGDPR